MAAQATAQGGMDVLLRRTFAIIGSAVIACIGVTGAAHASAPATSGLPTVNLSRPLIRVQGGAGAKVASDGIPVTYSSNWSGYAALPKKAGNTFTSIVGSYNVPRVSCGKSPSTFSYHWIGLDGWADATVEQDGIAADCAGRTAQYAAWFEMYPANFKFSFTVHPGDSIESAVQYLGTKNGKQRYELSLQDISTNRGFDVIRPCPVAACENSSAEAITEGYYYNKQYSGTSDFGNEHYGDVTVTDSAGDVGALQSSAWKTGEGIALGEYGDVDTTPGPLANTNSPYSPASAFTVFWSRKN